MTTETQINTQPSRFEAEKALRFSGFGADLRLTLDIYMNRTLFSCGLRKSVELKDGRPYDITTTLENDVMKDLRRSFITSFTHNRGTNPVTIM